MPYFVCPAGHVFYSAATDPTEEVCPKCSQPLEALADAPQQPRAAPPPDAETDPSPDRGEHADPDG